MKTPSLEWKVLLECARLQTDRARINDVLAQLFDWPSLYDLADEHSLLPLLSVWLTQIGLDLVPADILQKLKDFRRSYAVFTLQMAAGLFEVLDHLSSENLEVIVTKGPVLSMRCYGDPSARVYTDLDLIVRTDEIYRATELMIELGYEPRISLTAIAAGKIPGEYVFISRRNGVVVEFHTEFSLRYHPRQSGLEARLFKDKTWVSMDQRSIPAPCSEDELVLDSIHSAKHFWERLGWVADTAALISKCPDLNWDRTITMAEAQGAARMLRVAVQAAMNVLQVRLPSEVVSYVNSDSNARAIAERIANRLPVADSSDLGIISRAVLRIKMCQGGLFPLWYVLRLSFSPTEHDWSRESGSQITRLLDSMRRPLRLAKKYGFWRSGQVETNRFEIPTQNDAH